jgi:UPF0755 protein
LKRFVVALGLAAVVAGGLFCWVRIGLLAVDLQDKTPRVFVVARGDGVREVAAKLKQGGLIRDPVIFFLWVKRLGIERNIQAGSFRLSPAMTTEEIARKLTLGTEDVWITVLEGWRGEQILDYLKNQITDNGLEITTEEVGKWKREEGKYFPDTYLVPKQITLEAVRQLLRRTFDEKTAPLGLNNSASGLTAEEVIILASLVERETKTDADRALVAGVLSNRLKIGMKLDVDATVQYVIGFTKADGWWKKNLTSEDLQIKSPYNTYLYAGLPPSPICNPGLAALKAVLDPTETDYFYYLSDKTGAMHYAVTFSEHKANIAKFLE